MPAHHQQMQQQQVQQHVQHQRLGSVAGPVIQAAGRSEFEDGLGSCDFVSRYSYHMSVRTRLPDHTKQTKFQSQRPNDVETSVPSIWVQKWSNIGTVSTWMGDRLEWYPPPRKNADCSCWLPVLYHIVRNWSKFVRAPHLYIAFIYQNDSCQLHLKTPCLFVCLVFFFLFFFVFLVFFFCFLYCGQATGHGTRVDLWAYT
jgi:hypothetical protein